MTVCAAVTYGPTVPLGERELEVGDRLWHFKGGGHVVVAISTCREHPCGGGCDWIPGGDEHRVEVCECGEWPDYAEGRHWAVLA